MNLDTYSNRMLNQIIKHTNEIKNLTFNKLKLISNLTKNLN